MPEDLLVYAPVGDLHLTSEHERAREQNGA